MIAERQLEAVKPTEISRKTKPGMTGIKMLLKF